MPDIFQPTILLPHITIAQDMQSPNSPPKSYDIPLDTRTAIARHHTYLEETHLPKQSPLPHSCALLNGKATIAAADDPFRHPNLRRSLFGLNLVDLDPTTGRNAFKNIAISHEVSIGPFLNPPVGHSQTRQTKPLVFPMLHAVVRHFVAFSSQQHVRLKAVTMFSSRR